MALLGLPGAGYPSLPSTIRPELPAVHATLDRSLSNALIESANTKISSSGPVGTPNSIGLGGG
ncbi:hypothetical protein GCM10022222_07930 [Amycolatopsis ultiminotia]|uniref:Uncharacterized protein n=1 Tax=Amycolatopsis ultiminotia TaxID=543629 RepID=A0ABP6V2W2_9PSEU